MKTITLLSAIVFTASLASAQVTYRTIPEATQPVALYDSLENIPATHVKSLYNQKILALKKSNFYPKMDSFSSLEETSIVNKQFNILKAKRNEKRRETWLILAAGTDTIYYQLTNNSIENPSFITIGYFEKQAKTYTGKKFTLKLPEEFKELNAGIIKQFSGKETFICTGSTVIQDGKKLIPALTLKSSKGDEIYTPIKGFEVTTANNIQLFTIE
jgi:hypothetical protein